MQNAAYDYDCCRRVWQRVNPQENPYPTMRSNAAEQSELSLPGAEGNPCCMGTKALESIEVLEDFIRGEIEDARKYAALAKTAPTQTRKAFHRMAEDERGHARKLSAVYYLITGRRYCPQVVTQKQRYPSFFAMLRSFYHEEACGGFNYLRASEEALDYCLENIFSELSQDEYRHADCLLDLLGKGMRM